ncbi:arginyltransferase [Candidatus Spongiihabitans sp.]|uniref:arginyltransferase n=1 Tax=Candidatus Spongiihabitans sp. TaxID=3101308 RepID=UPI003C6F2199
MTIQLNPPKLYLSAPHACPYIEPETATTVLLDPNYKVDNALFSVLLNSGFRRSGKTIYRPHCRNCKACVSVKIPANAYLPNRAQIRCYKKNQDLHTTMVPTSFKQEHFELYCRYQSWRHSGDTMDHNDSDRYHEFVVKSLIETVFMEYRLKGKLIGLSVCDLPDDGMSAVYTFFDPDFSKRSLGTFAIMKQIEYVRQIQMDWLYLGYWIEGCKKMSYKTNFKPMFGFVNQAWRPM